MIRPGVHRVGLLLALLALAAQLAWGATVPDPALAQLGLGVICHTGTPGGAPTAPTHRAPDCALCPLCGALTMPAPTLARAPAVPPPRIVAIAPAVVLPPATAPPATIPLAAQPRGPPALA